MNSRMLYTIFLLSFLSFTSKAQESVIATSLDHSTNYILVGKVEKKMFHREAWIKKSSAKNDLTSFRKKEIELKTSHNLSIDGYDKFLYSMDLYQFDCKSKKYKVVEVVDYDSNGKVLAREKTTESKWIDVIPESISDKLFKVVCND